jgi:nucleoid-associated protein YgaU
VKPRVAQFQRLKPDGSPLGAPLKVQFNPTEYTLSKGAQIAEVTIPGLDSPLLQFVRGQTETLTLDLFFDSTEKGMGRDATPVTAETDRFYQLIKIESARHAPPIVLFSWGGKEFPGHRSYASLGSQQRYGFKCVVDSVRQRFTLFSPVGVPLRATLTVSLKEYKTLTEQIRELNLQSPDHTKVHIVQQGETLSRIAWQTYDNPADWRRVAESNDITDPLSISAGMILRLPPAG